MAIRSRCDNNYNNHIENTPHKRRHSITNKLEKESELRIINKSVVQFRLLGADDPEIVVHD